MLYANHPFTTEPWKDQAFRGKVQSSRWHVPDVTVHSYHLGSLENADANWQVQGGLRDCDPNPPHFSLDSQPWVGIASLDTTLGVAGSWRYMLLLAAFPCL